MFANSEGVGITTSASSSAILARLAGSEATARDSGEAQRKCSMSSAARRERHAQVLGGVELLPVALVHEGEHAFP